MSIQAAALSTHEGLDISRATVAYHADANFNPSNNHDEGSQYLRGLGHLIQKALIATFAT